MSRDTVPSESLAHHRATVRRYLTGIVRDPAAAEDLTQETLLRAHRKLPTLHERDKLLSWLYRIATNLARDRFRSAAHHHRPEPLDDSPDTGPRRSSRTPIAP